jgi:hypothetical protein
MKNKHYQTKIFMNNEKRINTTIYKAACEATGKSSRISGK